MAWSCWISCVDESVVEKVGEGELGEQPDGALIAGVRPPLEYRPDVRPERPRARLEENAGS